MRSATITARPDGPDDPPRGLITIAVMLATIMQAVDSTIATVALPHMQGSLSATQERISWVLTSCIVASAIFMPLTGILSRRLGRKRVFLWSVAGFAIASMLSGAAQSLEQVVLFRFLQGVFGAALVPLSQAVLLDTHPPERHGWAMAIWGVGVMVGPILGPTLGGWLTEHYNWRWVFYINVPFGILAWLGIALFVRETPLDPTRRFDLFGFLTLATAIGALQWMLDRGESLGWFQHREIIVAAIIAGSAFYLFLAHVFTHTHPFIDPHLFRDRNFTVGILCMFMVGAVLFATMALLPTFVHNVMNYPVIDAGYVLAARGLGTMSSLFAMSRIAHRVDPRLAMLVGLGLAAGSLWEMTRFTADNSSWDITRSGFMQGFGLGFIFAPLTTVTFSTLAPQHRNDGTALFSLLRSLGSSIGISVVIAYLAQRTQTNHAVLAAHAHWDNLPLRMAIEAGTYDLVTPEGLLALDREVTRQATLLAYLQDFRMMMWFTLAIVPLVLLLRVRRAAPPGAA